MQKITDKNRYQMLLVNLQEKMSEVFAQSIGVSSIEDGEVLEFFSRKAELLIGSFVDEFGYMKITDKLELVVNRHCDIDEWTTEFPIGKEASAHFLKWVSAYDKIPNLEGPGYPKSEIALSLAEAQVSEFDIEDFLGLPTIKNEALFSRKIHDEFLELMPAEKLANAIKSHLESEGFKKIDLVGRGIEERSKQILKGLIYEKEAEVDQNIIEASES